MPKSRVRKPKKPSTKKSGGRRKANASALERWDFRVALPDAPDEVLATICPLSPEHTLEVGKLTHSPAVAYVNSAREGISDETLRHLSRWPFRIARSGSAGSWVCLALLAYEQGLTVVEAAEAIIELEDSRLLTWSSDHDVYVMTPEMPQDHRSEQGLASVDALFERIENETAAQRAHRRWAPRTVVATPLEPGGSEDRS